MNNPFFRENYGKMITHAKLLVNQNNSAKGGILK